jgi:hypothetical protein
MLRGFLRLAALTVFAILATHILHAGSGDTPPLVRRFLDVDGPGAGQFRAFRHLEAGNEQFDSHAWMDVWTEADAAGGFRYEIVSAGGSEYIRRKVFLAALDAEQRMWRASSSDLSAFTSSNYMFEDQGIQPDGLATIRLKPRRKDLLLVDGSIFLRPDDGELVRMEGRLSKTPSFWARRVEIVRWFQRLAGVRMPVAVESTASIRIAGRSTFRMTYEYESVNGQRVQH